MTSGLLICQRVYIYIVNGSHINAMALHSVYRFIYIAHLNYIHLFFSLRTQMDMHEVAIADEMR